jgi:hypothetical protein
MATFERFESIEHLPLKVFNRVVMLNNILVDMGKEASASYINTFSEGERKQMYIMQMYIKSKGEVTVRKEVTKGLEVVDEVTN